MLTLILPAWAGESVLNLADVDAPEAQIAQAATVAPETLTTLTLAAIRQREARLEGAYAWKSLLDSGAVVAGGSDFPVESANPFFGLHAAVTRQSQDNQPDGGWLPDQLVSRDVALTMFTEGAAYAAHQEKVIGKLKPGYAADFILVRDDYFEVPALDIWRNQVLETWVAGNRVYQK